MKKQRLIEIVARFLKKQSYKYLKYANFERFYYTVIDICQYIVVNLQKIFR